MELEPIVWFEKYICTQLGTIQFFFFFKQCKIQQRASAQTKSSSCAGYIVVLVDTGNLQFHGAHGAFCFQISLCLRDKELHEKHNIYFHIIEPII